MLERFQEGQPLAAPGLQGDPALAASDDLQQLYACIAHLAPMDRLLVSLYLEEMQSAEIGAVLGISEGNVRVKLHRVKAQLRELWEKETYEPR